MRKMTGVVKNSFTNGTICKLYRGVCKSPTLDYHFTMNIFRHVSMCDSELAHSFWGLRLTSTLCFWHTRVFGDISDNMQPIFKFYASFFSISEVVKWFRRSTEKEGRFLLYGDQNLASRLHGIKVPIFFLVSKRRSFYY